MSQQEQETQYQQQPVQEQQIQQPRYGGGGSGGGGERQGPSEYTPKEVSQIFALLQSISEKYFWKASMQPIPEAAIRDLHRVIFSVIRKSTSQKNRLLELLGSMNDQADAQRIALGNELTAEQMGEQIRETIERIKDCFFPIFPDDE